MMSLTFKFKKSLFALLIVVGVYTFFAWYKYTHPEIVPGSSGFNFNMGSSAVKNTSGPLSAAAQDHKVPVEPASANDIKPGTTAWVKMANEYTAWTHAHGWYLPWEKSDYESYDLPTLKALADGGDVKALLALGDKILHEGDIKNASIYYEQAAVRGATSAINNLGIFVEPNTLDTFATEAEKNKAYYETLAYYKVLYMRGDRWVAQGNVDYLVDRRQLHLTAEDNEAITKRAQEIYDDLQARRIALGLGEFDNTVPTAFK